MIMLLHLTRVDDVMCFKRISFLFLVQKKRLEVNVGEKWNLLSIIVNIGKSRQYCLNENIIHALLSKCDKLERVLSDITKPRLPPSFWISALVDFGHVLATYNQEQDRILFQANLSILWCITFVF